MNFSLEMFGVITEQTGNKESCPGLLTPLPDQFITKSFYNTSVIQISPSEMTPNEHLDATFIALADPTRRAILARLMEGEASVNELAAPFDISQPAISKHLKILERAGLVSRSASGTRRPVKIEAAPMKQAVDWLEKYRKFWEVSYGRLDALLEALQTPINTDKPSSRKKDEPNA